jgi:uncharacterized protein (TIGR03083 family)
MVNSPMMDYRRYLDCLEADFSRLRSVAQNNLSAAVPTCPGWTVADLTRHLAQVYLHKTVSMREGVAPENWPPKEIEREEPLALLDRAHAELMHEFATRQPSDAAGGWYTPNQTVGFWARRMAQESVIHRIDAELAAGNTVAAVPDDLALDGIDELLKVFVAFSVVTWDKYFVDVLSDTPAYTYHMQGDGTSWHVRIGPGTFEVRDGPSTTPADVTISGSPTALLRWVWNREPSNGPAGVSVQGPAEAVATLKRCITTATQ